MVDKNIIAHELGHAVCSATQDGYWHSTSLGLEKTNNMLSYCECYKEKSKKKKLRGKYSSTKDVMNLGGIFGELLWNGNWSPWGCRADMDEFTTANQFVYSDLSIELDNWLWVDDDELSFRECSQLDGIEARRGFLIDHHDTCKRLPNLWLVYLDFCDRIDKISFRENIMDIAKSRTQTVSEKDLKAILKDIIRG